MATPSKPCSLHEPDFFKGLDEAELRDGGAVRLHTRLPHAVMSRMIGITYEECVRIIRDWCHDPAILTYQRGGILTVLDREALERELVGS